MQAEIEKVMRVLGFGELQARRHVKQRREFMRDHKLPPARWITRGD